jgi:hypothetical protein
MIFPGMLQLKPVITNSMKDKKIPLALIGVDIVV